MDLERKVRGLKIFKDEIISFLGILLILALVVICTMFLMIGYNDCVDDHGKEYCDDIYED